MAELSNPFLILRTALKISGRRDTKIYNINEIVFAVVFIFIRMFCTPVVAIMLYEGDRVLAEAKIGTCLILYIQLFWCYKILYNIGQKLMEYYGSLESKDKKIPIWVVIFDLVFRSINFNKKVKTIVATVNFILVIIAPLYYYGIVRGTIFNNY